MSKALVVIDMQNDFVDGALGSAEAKGIVGKVVEKIRKCKEEGYMIYATQDTHDKYYMESQEGERLPVVHCIKGTHGWEIVSEVHREIDEHLYQTYEKSVFGCVPLARALARKGKLEEIEVVGVCTDICVISNVLLFKSFMPEVRIVVDSSCCAGSTVEKHKEALSVLKSCQVDVI